jgi:potassium-transporting ATPase potassium-binding subunit
MSSTLAGGIQVFAIVLVLALAWKLLGDYMARVFTSEHHWRVETGLYRLFGIDAAAEQSWRTYAAGVLGFSFVGIILLYLVQRLQQFLPMAFGHDPVPAAVAFNTAISFVTNTNWQSYTPETTVGNTVQMAGLTVQNIVSASVGIVVAIVLIRGFVRFGTDRLGNFWVDLTRCVVRIMLPIAFVFAIVLMATGVVMSFRSGVAITAVDGSHHTLPLAPAASQEAVKVLGTNGGGVFNANSAHPFENPDGLSNFVEYFLELVIPVSLTRTFGTMVRNVRQGVVLVVVMGIVWLAFVTLAWLSATHPNGPATQAAGAALEGEEVRLGIPSSILFAISTTGTSTGAIDTTHDSLTGGAGGITILNMLLGEVAPGGTGSGLYGILVIAIIAVFLAGLMVGRSPEYLGKKLGRVQVTAASISILVMPALVLVGTGAAIAIPGTLSALNNTGAHGFAEVLYAYASTANNNGSAFAGLTVTSDFFQITTGSAMLFGRFIPMLAVLALASSLARQKRVEAGAGTLPTDGALFGVLVGGTLMLIAALTFFPALALGPIAEALS